MTAGIQDHPELTARQFGLFDLLREYRGSVVKYETIGERLGHVAGPTSRAAIKSLVAGIRHALGTSETIEVIAGRGVRLKHRPDVIAPVQNSSGPVWSELRTRDCIRCGHAFQSFGASDSTCSFCMGGTSRPKPAPRREAQP